MTPARGMPSCRASRTPRLTSCSSRATPCDAVLKDVPGSLLTSHVNESLAEIASVARLFPDAIDYVDTYDRHGLLGPTSVLAHDVHPTERELHVLVGQRATIAHCPTSSAALGSGLFPLRDHVEHGVRAPPGGAVSPCPGAPARGLGGRGSGPDLRSGRLGRRRRRLGCRRARRWRARRELTVSRTGRLLTEGRLMTDWPGLKKCAQRTIITGHSALWMTLWLTEPSSRPLKPPRPREPTTMSPAVEPRSAMARPGSP